MQGCTHRLDNVAHMTKYNSNAHGSSLQQSVVHVHFVLDTHCTISVTQREANDANRTDNCIHNPRKPKCEQIFDMHMPGFVGFRIWIPCGVWDAMVVHHCHRHQRKKPAKN